MPKLDPRAVIRYVVRVRSAKKPTRARTLYKSPAKAPTILYGNELIATWRGRGYRVRKCIKGLWSVSKGPIVVWLEFARIR